MCQDKIESCQDKQGSLARLAWNSHAQRQGISQRVNDEREDPLRNVCRPQTEYVPCLFVVLPTILNSYTVDFILPLCNCIVYVRIVLFVILYVMLTRREKKGSRMSNRKGSKPMRVACNHPAVSNPSPR